MLNMCLVKKTSHNTCYLGYLAVLSLAVLGEKQVRMYSKNTKQHLITCVCAFISKDYNNKLQSADCRKTLIPQANFVNGHLT